MAIDYTVSYDPGLAGDLITDVRMTIQDVDITTNPPSASLVRAQWSVLFTDQEIIRASLNYGLLGNQSDMTAAHLLDDISLNAALLAKHITLGDYSSDTRTTAKGLRDAADWLRGRYARAQAAGSEEPAESISQDVWTDFAYRGWIYSHILN